MGLVSSAVLVKMLSVFVPYLILVLIALAGCSKVLRVSGGYAACFIASLFQHFNIETSTSVRETLKPSTGGFAATV
jgi:hypothetical protein